MRATISDYALLLLRSLARGCSTPEALAAKIASYPEDRLRDGVVRGDSAAQILGDLCTGLNLKSWFNSPAYERDKSSKELLGHSSIKIIVDVCGHLAPGANRQAVNRLPSLGGVQAPPQKEKQG